MPLPGWLSHGASFCVGAAAAAAGLLLRSSSGGASGGGGVLDASDVGGRVTEEAVPRRPSPSLGDGGGDTGSSALAKMLPTPNVRMFQPNGNLLIAFDARSKNPLFVMERLTAESLRPTRHNPTDDEQSTAAAASRKNKRFHEESSLLPYHRSRNHHYRGSGYDRGHLSPAADFPFNEQEMHDTFALTNVSPQRPRFNRSAWLRLEEFLRDVARREGADKETWVLSGPLWLPSSVAKDGEGGERFQYSYEGIGRPPSLITVPTHFYKVVVVVERTPKAGDATTDADVVLAKFAAFVLPNSDTFGNSNRIRLIDHAVRLTDLEAVSGLEFFPALLGMENDGSSGRRGPNDVPLRKEMVDALTDDVRFGSRASNRLRNGTDSDSALMPYAGSEKWSKGRQRRVRQILRENESVPFQHLCFKNDACFALLSV